MSALQEEASPETPWYPPHTSRLFRNPTQPRAAPVSYPHSYTTASASEALIFKRRTPHHQLHRNVNADLLCVYMCIRECCTNDNMPWDENTPPAQTLLLSSGLEPRSITGSRGGTDADTGQQEGQGETKHEERQVGGTSRARVERKANADQDRGRGQHRRAEFTGRKRERTGSTHDHLGHQHSMTPEAE